MRAASWLLPCLLFASAPAAAQVPLPDSSLSPVPETTPEKPSPVVEAPHPVPEPVPVATPVPAPAASDMRFPLLLPRRSTADVSRDQGSAAGIVAAAEAEIAALRIKVAESRARVAGKKQELGVLETRLKAAKKAKQEGEAAALERDRRRLEAEQRFYERLEDADQADLARASAARDYGKAWAAAASTEADFAVRTGERTEQPARAIRDLEVRVLTTQRTAAERLESLASRQQQLAAQRVRVHDAWNALQGR